MSNGMKIYLATDHAGFKLKNVVKDYLEKIALYEVTDCGAFTHEPLDDYPDFIALAARQVSESPIESRAIIFGGSGQGEAMLANRFKNVRAAVYYGGPTDILTLSREHNDSNILSLGARFLSDEETVSAVKLWLRTDFNHDEKYTRRVKKSEHLSLEEV